MSNVTRIKPSYYPTLAERVEEYRTLDREIKKMQQGADVLKAAIIQEMGNSESVFNALGHEVATYKSQFATRFDKEIFERSYPGIYEQFEYKKESKVFRLKQ